MMSPSLRSLLQAPRTPCTLLPEAHPTQTQDQLKACLAQHLSTLESASGGGQGRAQMERLECSLGGQERRAPPGGHQGGRQSPSLLCYGPGEFGPRQLMSNGPN
ncbi:hypothetical protein PAL_GLEAN10022963 [Pteropus alecto]|uniref:Uncharacterized protein n=1 Tax=Pteropus alecto TaxID=9402 RepID=L5K5G8_PTEAL|nr:hypothetical protein PAL_GLEAN10022963 [Pteropus alecto]